MFYSLRVRNEVVEYLVGTPLITAIQTTDLGTYLEKRRHSAIANALHPGYPSHHEASIDPNL